MKDFKASYEEEWNNGGKKRHMSRNYIFLNYMIMNSEYWRKYINLGIEKKAMEQW